MSFDAIILCGGSARRLDGADKSRVVVGGRSLLERAVDAVGEAATIVAVGPPAPTTMDVTWTWENPPGGGPVAGLAAGLDLSTQDIVMVLGVDFPFVDRGCVEKLLAALGKNDGAIVADAAGRPQFLVGAYKRPALETALHHRDTNNMAVKEIMAHLRLEVLEDPRSARDCDTWADVAEVNGLMAKEMS